jgi:integrase
MKNPEPRYYRRKWTSPDGAVNSTWVVRWHTDLKRGGRRLTKEKGGFFTKQQAITYFKKHVIPALEAGFNSPEEEEQANVSRLAAEGIERLTVGAWFDRYQEESRLGLRPRSLDDQGYVFREAKVFWGSGKDLASITERDIREFLAKPTKYGEPSRDTIRKRYNRLRSVFAKAVARGFLDANPLSGIKVPKPGQGRVYFLEPKECVDLLNACLQVEATNLGATSSHFLRALVAAALYTGGRRDELFHLEWTDLQERDGIVMIQPKEKWRWTTKNGKRRILSVNPHLFEILREYRDDRTRRREETLERLRRLEDWRKDRGKKNKEAVEIPPEIHLYERPPSIRLLIEKARGVAEALKLQIASPLVFPNLEGHPFREVPRGFHDAIKIANLDTRGITFHALRHTYASLLRRAGVDLPTIKELMGHSDIKTTMIYAHLAPDHVTRAGARVSLKLEPDADTRPA